MSERELFRIHTTSGVPRPAPNSTECSHCQRGINALRAARVALYGNRFHYFCSAECRREFQPEAVATRVPVPQKPALTDNRGTDSVPPAVASAPATLSAADALADQTAEHYPLEFRWSLGCALIALAIELYQPLTPAFRHWSFVLASLSSCGALALGWLRGGPLGQARHWVWTLAAPTTGTLAAASAMNIAPDARTFLGVNAAVLCAVAAGTSELSLRHSRRARSLAGQMRKGLSLSGRRLHDGGVVHEVPADELKPGEEIVIDSGQTVPADAVIVAGQASVRPWLGSKLTVTRTEGDTVVAGSKVLSGALRAVVRWAGDDRAWARLTYDPLRRADRHTAPGRLAKRLATTGAVGAGGAVALALISAKAQPALIVGYAAAAFGALANVAIPELTALAVWHAMRALLARGVSFRTPDALDRASQISTAVFCSRGTLLSGAPRVASIEPFGTTDTHTLLAWMAGAYRSTPSATGAALQLAAREHQVQADAARSPTYYPGLGITAVASTGQPLVVGARDLLLRQRVSVAAAEGRITELERLGRSVVLVALDGRLVGLVALQDSLTLGARAAVQQLLDAGVEPVWISVDSRQTSDALAGRIGIAHVRPEVAFDECALEIQRLQRSGHRVAVIGRGSVDDLALGAGDLSINVGSRGGVLERWDVDILSGDLRDAATAVRVCRQVRAQTFAARLTICGPVVATLALLPLGVPAWSAPLAGLVGAAFAARGLTATATRRTGRKDADR